MLKKKQYWEILRKQSVENSSLSGLNIWITKALWRLNIFLDTEKWRLSCENHLISKTTQIPWTSVGFGFQKFPYLGVDAWISHPSLDMQFIQFINWWWCKAPDVPSSSPSWCLDERQSCTVFLLQCFLIVSLSVTLLNRLTIMKCIFGAQDVKSLDVQPCIGKSTHFNSEYHNSWPLLIMWFTKGQKSNLTVLQSWILFQLS